MDNNMVLHLPENFHKACERFSIHPLEALQFFISKNTVYSFIVKPTDTLSSVASRIFDLWRQTEGAVNGKMDDYKRLLGVKYVKQLLRTIMAIDEPKKRDKAYDRIIVKWYDSIAVKLPPKTVKTTNDLTVLLTKDFCILCDIFKGTPASLLQFYVNHISLSASLNPSTDIETAFASAFFFQYPPVEKQIRGN